MIQEELFASQNDDNRDKIIIDKKEFFVDELDENQIYYVNQIRSIRQRIGEAKFNLAQLHAAEVTFVDSLTKSVKKNLNGNSRAE
jgi:hypothetical protein|tara:strand:+ start:452 stop:706 length:255 start_codon:yes stop_codon:yes gene_type:complete